MTDPDQFADEVRTFWGVLQTALNPHGRTMNADEATALTKSYVTAMVLHQTAMDVMDKVLEMKDDSETWKRGSE